VGHLLKISGDHNFCCYFCRLEHRLCSIRPTQQQRILQWRCGTALRLPERWYSPTFTREVVQP